MAHITLKLNPKKDPRAISRADESRRRCPALRFKATWCRGLCRPRAGLGQCGLPAPHCMLGRTQQAILQHKRAKRQAEGAGLQG